MRENKIRWIFRSVSRHPTTLQPWQSWWTSSLRHDKSRITKSSAWSTQRVAVVRTAQAVARRSMHW